MDLEAPTGYHRWKITVEYDGRPFMGWQRQEHGASVQEEIEKAIVKYCGENATVYCSGRTDAGVHALGQVAHFDLRKQDDPFVVQSALNAHLRPHPISIIHAEQVAPDFHARFHAVKRRYFYRILNRRAAPALDAGRVWHIPYALDISLMQEGAKHLLGEHDFSSFRAAQCQAKSPVKSIDKIDFYRGDAGGMPFHNPDEIIMVIEARSFLHHQVRNIIGTLKPVGEGRTKPETVKEILEARDRTIGGITAPPDGLYFAKIWFSDDIATSASSS